MSIDTKSKTTLDWDALKVNGLVPHPTTWDEDKVVSWLYVMGFGRYEECFRDNMIIGSKLIVLDVSRLNRLGIQDFEHLKTLAEGIRGLIKQPVPDYFRTISMPYNEPLGVFLDVKCKTGQTNEKLTYDQYLKDNRKLLKHCYGRVVDPYADTNRNCS